MPSCQRAVSETQSDGVLPVEQHDVEVFGLRGAAELVEACEGIAFVERSHLGHELIAIARKGLERLAEHGGSRVSLRGFEEADAMIVGIGDEAAEFLLAECGLDLAVIGTGSERETRDLHA